MTSDLRIRPFLPVPVTLLTSIFISFTSRRTAGVSTVSSSGRRGSRGFSSCLFGSFDFFRRCWRFTGRFGCSRAGLDDGKQFVGRHNGAFLDLGLRQDTGDWRRDFQHHLVRLQVDQVFVAGYGLARFLMPCQYRCIADRFRKCGYAYLG